ncbi:MAG: Bifunctional phosphoglucose/phosphomannose isomerase, partial [Bacteroidota bacterium]|nr:Bifunctional phosphoglucose/phosphomannose isomerase [Bacteroidota bacterium]
AELRKIDSSDMYGIMKGFPEQVRQAIEIGKEARLFVSKDIPKRILILGMGGSAIGGDLLRSYSSGLEGAKHLNIAVNRNYNLPGNVDSDTYIIASSYSGGTEETISAFRQAQARNLKMLCISSGGELTEIAKENDIPVIKIPGGFQPRAALGYSFFPMLQVLIRTKAYSDKAAAETETALNELLTLIDEKSAIYSDFSKSNPAIELAEKIHGKIPVIYSNSEIFDTINIRWRGQIQENAKNMAFGNLLPEMNHNEINGWSFPNWLNKKFIVLFLEDEADHPRVKIRFDALASVLSEAADDVIRIKSEARSLLARMFDLIYLADWVSFYLALLNGVDPTPIPLISKLKNILSK